MCPFTPAQFASVVSLAHSSQPGSHSCTTRVSIQVACGCVMTTSWKSVRHPLGAGKTWTLKEMLLQQSCVSHAELWPHHMEGLSLALHGYTHADRTQSSGQAPSAEPAQPASAPAST
jgi:hypothetical protein